MVPVSTVYKRIRFLTHVFSDQRQEKVAIQRFRCCESIWRKITASMYFEAKPVTDYSHMHRSLVDGESSPPNNFAWEAKK